MYVPYAPPGAPHGFPGQGYGQPMAGGMPGGLYQQPMSLPAPPPQQQAQYSGAGFGHPGMAAGSVNMYNGMAGAARDPYGMYGAGGAGAAGGGMFNGQPQMDMGFAFKGGAPPQQQQQLPATPPQQYQQQQYQQQQQQPAMAHQQPSAYGAGQPADRPIGTNPWPAGVGHSGPGPMAAPAGGAPPGAGQGQEHDPDDDPNRLPTFVKVRGLPAEHDPRIARRPKPKKRAPGVACCV